MDTDDDIAKTPPHRFAIQGHVLQGHLRKDGDSTGDDWSWDSPCMVGIDEAGRGPVLGPMVYGSCIAPICRYDDMKAIGFADSKVLKKSERERLFKELQQTPYISWIVDPISPQDLSSAMLRHHKVSLNEVSQNSAISMIQLYIAKGYNVAEVYVDTLGSPDKYQKMLQQTFPQIPKIVVASKADALFPIVSAASICAKVTRDDHLEEWDSVEARSGLSMTSEFGSGYPLDPTTKIWLRTHADPIFGFPNLVRFSWSTASNLLDELASAVLWGDENDSNAKKSTAAWVAFGQKLAKLRFQHAQQQQHLRERIKVVQRSAYTQELKMDITTTLPF